MRSTRECLSRLTWKLTLFIVVINRLCKMKVATVILSVFVLQASGSFFDQIRGAVTSVEDSFGKLLSDVIYDVKETIDCTLFAVEQVLALGMFEDSAEYEARCKGAEGAAPEPPAPPAPPVLPALAVEPEPPAPVLTKQESRQIDSSVLSVDEVLCDVLKKDDTHSQLEGVKLALQNETQRLAEISDLLRKQLEELSSEVREKFKAIELQTSEPSVMTIWNDIKLLHEIEHKHENTAEAKKISHILDQILSILDANEEKRSTADDYKIKEIMRKLSKHSKDGTMELWKDADDYPKDFREYANKVFEESRTGLSSDNTNNVPKSKENIVTTTAAPTTVTVSTMGPKRRSKPTTTTTTEKILTIEELAAEYGSLFDVMPDIDSMPDKKAAETAKNIVEQTKLNEMVMKSLADVGSNKGAQNLFDDPDLFRRK